MIFLPYSSQFSKNSVNFLNVRTIRNIECHHKEVVNGRLWHERLGHPHVEVVKTVWSNMNA